MYRLLLEAFAQLRTATISFMPALCLSVRMEQLSSHWADLHKILYLKIFRKFVQQIQV